MDIVKRFQLNINILIQIFLNYSKYFVTFNGFTKYETICNQESFKRVLKSNKFDQFSSSIYEIESVFSKLEVEMGPT